MSDKTDVAGLQKRTCRNAKSLFWPMTMFCGAFGIGSRAQADIRQREGRGFGAALFETMKRQGGNPTGARVLIIGAGPWGQGAAQYVSDHQAIRLSVIWIKKKRGGGCRRN